MTSLLSHIGLAASAFVVTNIDDLLLLSAYFAQPNVRVKHIVAGQYIGVAALVMVSLLGLVLGQLLPTHAVRWLGLVPLLLGVRDFIQLLKKNGEENAGDGAALQQTFLKIAMVTFANGGDNIGVYTPLFATLQPELILVYVIVFAVLVAVWCVTGYWLTRHPLVQHVFQKYGKIILPIFLVLLGLWIIFG
ncbi:cadmium resistance transporter [Chryseolinea lacunae]|uniref:Cadmium resistance transporter n=1 Tax=Chryseolinea lacunae TaxID=2801331 RepID=A0ABS1KZV0_9BACT|nr:cadmium resistance transporter [Chryseolinea lacunae]MBL0744986.1 cadmium resistance transporter [Chryseolinea lacunae]